MLMAEMGDSMKKMCMGIAVAGLLMLGGCNKVPENTVFSLEDLEGKKIGVQLETTGDVYATDIKDAQVKRFNKSVDAVEALAAGELDAVILDDGPAEVFVEENDNLRILDELFAEEEYGLVVKKGNRELLDRINAALSTIRKNGTLEQILQGWIYDGAKTSVYQGQDKESYANGTLVVATNAEFPPYESKTEDGIAGIDIDIMKAVCDEMDMKLEIRDIAFDSIIAALDKGSADVGAAAMSITEERKASVDFSDSYTTARQVVIVRKD